MELELINLELINLMWTWNWPNLELTKWNGPHVCPQLIFSVGETTQLITCLSGLKFQLTYTVNFTWDKKPLFLAKIKLNISLQYLTGFTNLPYHRVPSSPTCQAPFLWSGFFLQESLDIHWPSSHHHPSFWITNRKKDIIILIIIITVVAIHNRTVLIQQWSKNFIIV